MKHLKDDLDRLNDAVEESVDFIISAHEDWVIVQLQLFLEENGSTFDDAEAMVDEFYDYLDMKKLQ